MMIKDNENANKVFSDYIKQNSLKNMPIIALLSSLFIIQRLMELLNKLPLS